MATMTTTTKPAAGAAAAAATLEVQHQIRANAAQLQDYFSDLYAWEKSVNQEDEARKKARAQQSRAAGTQLPPPRPRVSVGRADSEPSAATKPQAHPAAHTYDKGYSKWAKFDVEAALRDADGDIKQPPALQKETPVPASRTAAASGSPAPDASTAVTTATAKSREDLEREEGNAHYKRGDFVAAIKCYTRCLGFNARNAVVLSNRAMAFLKNREYAKAEDDCDLALRIDPSHVKSLSRRATARNALGKHRLALLDLERAVALDPKSRQLQTQVVSTKELMRAAIKRSPTQTTKVLIQVIESSERTEATAVASSVSSKQQALAQDNSVANDRAVEDKENAPSANRSVCANAKPKESKTTTALSLPVKSDAVPVNAPAQEESNQQQQPAVASTTEKPARLRDPIKATSQAPIPKLPKKAPTTSYEFGRVWKSLALKGDSAQRAQLLAARAAYLELIPPATLRTVFKDSIEPDTLCELFHVFRFATFAHTDDSATDSAAVQFVLAFATALATVPRFSMAVMFLTAREKEDMVWVFSRLRTALDASESDLDALAKRYEV